MATTTNYSWTTPDDTDLVKDGASAIRALGTAIDTTVFTNAGAAISKSLVDAKGDIIAATADNTVDRLAVGANDTVLMADSSTATGLKWAAVAGGAGNLSQIATGTLSGSSVTFSSLSAYTELYLYIDGATWNTGNDKPRLRINGNDTNAYSVFGVNVQKISSSSLDIDPVEVLSTSSWQLAVREFADRTDTNNTWAIKITNCKTAGFTAYESFCTYDAADTGYQNAETMRGIYAVSETVSSLEISTNSSLTFSAGSYTLWGA